MKRASEWLIGIGMFGFPVAYRFVRETYGSNNDWVLFLLAGVLVFGIIARVILGMRDSAAAATTPQVPSASPAPIARPSSPAAPVIAPGAGPVRVPPYCPDCGSATQGGKFCPSCGKAFVPKNQCASCAAIYAPGTRFCPECGVPAA